MFYNVRLSVKKMLNFYKSPIYKRCKCYVHISFLLLTNMECRLCVTSMDIDLHPGNYYFMEREIDRRICLFLSQLILSQI